MVFLSIEGIAIRYLRNHLKGWDEFHSLHFLKYTEGSKSMDNSTV